MPKHETAAPKAETKQKRTILSPAERAAKLRAEAEALEAKIQQRAKDQVQAQEARVAQLQGQVDDRQAKLDDAKAELAKIKELAGITEDPSTDES